MSKAILMHTDGTNEVIDVPNPIHYTWYAKVIGCEWFEIIHGRNMPDSYVMIGDEEAKLKDCPLVNFQASWFYDTQDHGEPVCGDCLLMKEIEGDDGGELIGFNDDEVEEILHMFQTYTPIAIAIIRHRLRENLLPL